MAAQIASARAPAPRAPVGAGEPAGPGATRAGGHGIASRGSTYTSVMQDRYTGDVGDFGKYGLLRWLCGQRGHAGERLRLGVIWYRTDSRIVASDPANDGKHVGYLRVGNESAYRPCDPLLYDGLRAIVRRGERRVAAVERSCLLGRDTRFFAEYVPAPPGGARGSARIIARHRWFAEALRATQACNLLFLDPDNGLEARSAPMASSRAPKYAYLEELERLIGRGQSIVVYHHLGRSGTHAEQVARWSGELRERLEPHHIFALRLGRGSGRAFFVLATAEHASLLRARARALLASSWRQHFTQAS